MPSNGQPLLPKYMGSNALFIPLPQYAFPGHPNVINGNLISQSVTPLLIGHILGGIISSGPTSGTTPNGNVATGANPLLPEFGFFRH